MLMPQLTCDYRPREHAHNDPPQDLYSIKEVDRRLCYSIIEPHFFVCDVGGAAGIDVLPMTRLVKQSILIDIDKNALKTGKAMATKSKIRPKMAFIKASATDLPFKKGVLDLITCFSVLDHLSTKETAFKAMCEFSRVARNRGYIAITVPNKLFLLGTIIMKIKYTIQVGDFWEQRFTPKELERLLLRSGFCPLIFDSKYPTKVGRHVLRHNFPKATEKIPGIYILLSFAGKIFGILEQYSCLKIFGARMGFLGTRLDSACTRFDAGERKCKQEI